MTVPGSRECLAAIERSFHRHPSSCAASNCEGACTSLHAGADHPLHNTSVIRYVPTSAGTAPCRAQSSHSKSPARSSSARTHFTADRKCPICLPCRSLVANLIALCRDLGKRCQPMLLASTRREHISGISICSPSRRVILSRPACKKSVPHRSNAWQRSRLL